MVASRMPSEALAQDGLLRMVNQHICELRLASQTKYEQLSEVLVLRSRQAQDGHFAYLRIEYKKQRLREQTEKYTSRKPVDDTNRGSPQLGVRESGRRPNDVREVTDSRQFNVIDTNDKDSTQISYQNLDALIFLHLFLILPQLANQSSFRACKNISSYPMFESLHHRMNMEAQKHILEL